MKTTKEPKLDGHDEESIEPFNVSYVQERVGTFVIDIEGVITSVSQFNHAIQALGIADEDNSVTINLQCSGGSLSAADALIHAMRKCKGQIHIVATGGCHSAATLILLEADSFELSEHFHALLHCGSLGNIANTNEYVAKASFDSKYMPKVLRSSYEGFLTEEEIERMLDGKDIWLDAEGWMERSEARDKHFRAKAAAFVNQKETGATVKPKKTTAKKV